MIPTIGKNRRDYDLVLSETDLLVHENAQALTRPPATCPMLSNDVKMSCSDVT